MSLFLPLSSDQYHAKPMAISSITSPVGIHSSSRTAVYDTNNSPSTVCPSPSSSTHSGNITPPPTNSNKSQSSSPQNRSFSNYSTTSSTSSFPDSLNVSKNLSSNGSLPGASSSSYYHPYHYVTNRECASENSNTSHTSAPLSLHERRLRNKTASAKYRAKKNQQHGEMRAMINSLTKENELLLRQLDHVQHENNHLKSTCDRLRGKLMAQKMLKQYLVETEQQQQNNSSGESIPSPVAMDTNYFVQYTTRKYPEMEEKRGLGHDGLRNDNLV
jgi:hypothetical protein